MDDECKRLYNNINAENTLNLSSIKKWQGKNFPNSSTVNKEIIFKEFDFFEGYLAPDSGIKILPLIGLIHYGLFLNYCFSYPNKQS